MHSVSVKVYRGASLVAEKDRPLRRTPDGRFGVTYRGAVYPLQRDNSIQLRDPSFSAYQCALATELPEWLSGAGGGDDIYIDASGRYAYLMLNGSESDLDSFLSRLAAAEIEIYSYGPSRRPADDGMRYDWYVRIDHEAARSIGQDEISPVAERETIRGGGDVAALQWQLAAANEKLRAAETRFDVAEAERAGMEARVAELTTAFQAEQHQRSALQRERDALAAGIERLRAGADESQNRAIELEVERASVESQLQELRSKLDVSEAARTEAEALAYEWAHERDELRVKLDEASERAEDLEARVGDLQAKNERLERSTEVRGKTLNDRIEAVLRAAFPSIDFLRDSLEFIVDDLADFKPVCRRLTDLCHRPGEVRAQTVESAGENWRELHFSTGSDDDGRIYFSRTGSSYHALLSRKHHQARDIRWLRQQKLGTVAPSNER